MWVNRSPGSNGDNEQKITHNVPNQSNWLPNQNTWTKNIGLFFTWTCPRILYGNTALVPQKSADELLPDISKPVAVVSSKFQTSWKEICLVPGRDLKECDPHGVLQLPICLSSAFRLSSTSASCVLPEKRVPWHSTWFLVIGLFLRWYVLFDFKYCTWKKTSVVDWGFPPATSANTTSTSSATEQKQWEVRRARPNFER